MCSKYPQHFYDRRNNPKRCVLHCGWSAGRNNTKRCVFNNVTMRGGGGDNLKRCKNTTKTSLNKVEFIACRVGSRCGGMKR